MNWRIIWNILNLKMLRGYIADSIVEYFLTNIENYNIQLCDGDTLQFDHKVVGTARLKNSTIPGIYLDIYIYQFEVSIPLRRMRIWNLTSTKMDDNYIRLTTEQCEWLYLKTG